MKTLLKLLLLLALVASARSAEVAKTIKITQVNDAGTGFATREILGNSILFVTDSSGHPDELAPASFELYLYAADAGSTDDYAITLSPAPASYLTGARFSFKANTANTGAATLDVNGLGAKTIKKVAGGVTTDLSTDDIRAGQIVVVQYDGTNFQMQSTLGNAAGGGGDMLLGTAQTVTAAKTFNAGTLKIASGGDLVDANGNELFKFTATGSAVNEFTVANAATGNPPTISTTGSNTDINFRISAKGSGGVDMTSGLSIRGYPDVTTATGAGVHIGISSSVSYLYSINPGTAYLPLVFGATKFSFSTAGTAEGDEVLNIGGAVKIKNGSTTLTSGAEGLYLHFVNGDAGYITSILPGTDYKGMYIRAKWVALYGSASAVEVARSSDGKNFLIGTTSDAGLTGAGGLSVASTTDATSATAASAIFAGGIGISKKIWQGISVAANTLDVGILAENPTAATSGNDRYSPMIVVGANIFSASASRSVKWAMFSSGSDSGAATPHNGIGFFRSTNGGAYGHGMTLSINGGTGDGSLIVGTTVSGALSELQLYSNGAIGSYLGQEGTAGARVTGTAVGDYYLRFASSGKKFHFSMDGSGGAATMIVAQGETTWTSGASANMLHTLQLNGSTKAFVALPYTTDQLVTGSAAGDLLLRVQGTSNRLIVSTDGGGIVAFSVEANNGGVKTSAPSGGTAAAWKFGTVSVTSPTSPNRTIELDVGGTRYFLAAKTTND